jgi:hypothetical protein
MPDKQIISLLEVLFPRFFNCSFEPFWSLPGCHSFSNSARIYRTSTVTAMEAELLEEHGALRTVKDLSAGAAGGIAQVLLGM